MDSISLKMVVTRTNVFLCVEEAACIKVLRGGSSRVPTRSRNSYRNETLHSDRNNLRGTVGKRLPRKTARTTRAIEKSSVCQFRMSIGLDGVGYYLVGGTRNSHHAYHPKLMKVECTVPTQLIGGVEKEILVSIGCAKANNGVGRSIHFSPYGYVIPRSQV